MTDVSAAPEGEHHPLLAQLSALNHARIYVDVAVVIVVLALTNLLAHFTTPWANVAVVPAAAVGLVLLVRHRGLGWTELGLGREHWKSGAGYAAAAIALSISASSGISYRAWIADRISSTQASKKTHPGNLSTVAGNWVRWKSALPLHVV